MNKETLRNEFFIECTQVNPDSKLRRFTIAPHDLFEWFWIKFNENKDELEDKKLTKKE